MPSAISYLFRCAMQPISFLLAEKPFQSCRAHHRTQNERASVNIIELDNANTAAELIAENIKRDSEKKSEK